MIKNYLIIISGAPCTGKTTLSKRIATELKLPLISRDEIKEMLFDSLGVKDKEWSKKLGAASYDILYKFLELLMGAKLDVVIESNFKSRFDSDKICELKKEYHFELIQIICKTNKKILLERFKQRSLSGERHPGHLDNQNWQEFKDSFIKKENWTLDIPGKIIKVNTTNLNKINYNKIINVLKSKLM